jgi:hypothetical protein
MEDYKLYRIKYEIMSRTHCREGEFLHRAKSEKNATSMARARLGNLKYTILEVSEQ